MFWSTAEKGVSLLYKSFSVSVVRMQGGQLLRVNRQFSMNKQGGSYRDFTGPSAQDFTRILNLEKLLSQSLARGQSHSQGKNLTMLIILSQM